MNVYLNRVILMGNLTKDPELKTAQSGKTYCRVNIAINKRTLDKTTGEYVNTADYIDFSLWEKQAENVCKYLRVGDALMVEGQLGKRKMAKTNGDVWSLELTVTKVQWAKKNGTLAGAGEDGGDIPAYATGADHKSENKTVDGRNFPYDDEVPF